MGWGLDGCFFTFRWFFMQGVWGLGNELCIPWWDSKAFLMRRREGDDDVYLGIRDPVLTGCVV